MVSYSSRPLRVQQPDIMSTALGAPSSRSMRRRLAIAVCCGAVDRITSLVGQLAAGLTAGIDNEIAKLGCGDGRQDDAY